MSALIPAAELGAWRRVRQYAVPATMIRAATAARLAGDWRGACAAANIDVGRDDFGLFADDLRHFAPDLLRWHLPRRPSRGDTTLTPRQLVVLARSGSSALYVALPRLGFGSQRLRLLVAGEAAAEADEEYHGVLDLTAQRHLWDVREAPELLRRTCGADTFEPLRESPVLALQDAGRTADAWVAAGIDLPPPPEADERSWRRRYLGLAFTELDVDPAVVLGAARRLAAEEGLDHVGVKVGWYHEVRLTGLDGPRPRGEWVELDYHREGTPGRLEPSTLRRPIDVHLVRLGVLPPHELHPLVFAAFFPSSPVPSPAADDLAPGPVRVRCNGAWHTVRMTGGRFEIPHSDEERQREHTLRALGGQLHGCFAAEHAWRDRAGRLPRHLDDQRRDLMLRAQHGDLTGVTALLDAGVDPHARDLHGRTLLHLLPGLMTAPGDLALPHRLLAAGLDVEARDARGRTPLHTAVHGGGSPELVRALLAAGARPDTQDHVGDSLRDSLHRHREDDLGFLAELLA
ncbi:hypothetical protein GCM10010399_66750 [Dactylosporangium fulvum]|uniref:Ankyrin repeat domain-containing protein n=1 Tax=Dactylosporangium fulvum TaxID=53359 RepID=A0ABY5VT02_9ACTN|nr:ankyrin repeat domain-containing protein [Dactylosporangium fulvum]UWP80882.1 ankyrin repeat domain-containing protein [Dactylosporangium fulvum]